MNKLQQLISETKRPFLVSGPCSVESEEQIFTIIRDLKKTGKVNLLRAGIWKPRTRPDSFEGLGEMALPWYVQASKEAGIKCSTEIANAKHVELALKHGVDVLWIGARTTVNPFTVQEIADALAGTNVPIMIKNPINPDLSLWLGAFERLEKAGVSDLVAIHRGFSVYTHPKYRNVPSWEIPIGLKEKMPEIPLLCDPSHITGNRKLLLEVSQKAMDLNFNGLMIETHHNPDKAWSDAEQQITAFQLEELLASLHLRSSIIPTDKLNEMEHMREKIANLDERIFEMLSARMRISEEVGVYKSKNNITILQEQHWNAVIENNLKKSESLGLTPKFIRSMIDAIHQESIRHQIRVMNPDQLGSNDK